MPTRIRTRTMNTIMAPVLEPVRQDLRAGVEVHSLCLGRLANAQADTIRKSEVPANVPMIFDGDRTRLLYIATVRLTRLQNSKGTFNVAPAYLPPPITIGIAWDKPYVRLIPITGLTPDDWQAHYPPFHYTLELPHEICVGKVFAIGEASDPTHGLSALVELLGIVNTQDAFRQPATVAVNYPNPWEHWARGHAAVLAGQPQDVLTPAGLRL